MLPVILCLYGGDYTKYNLSNVEMDRWKADDLAVTRLRIGLYSLHIEHWLKAFPKDQLLFIRLEDWSKNRTRILNEHVFPLLDLPSVPIQRIATEKAQNKNWHGKNVNMHNSTRQLLKDFYRPFNKKLSSMLQDDSYLWSDIS